MSVFDTAMIIIAGATAVNSAILLYILWKMLV